MIRKGLSLPAQQQSNTRELYSGQSAHALIIDTLRPGNSEAGQAIVTALQNLFSVVCSLTGPCRIPCLSLLASCQRTDMFLPMQRVSKALFPRLHVSLQEILKLVEEGSVNQEEGEFSSVEQAIREAKNNYAKFKELSHFTNQLEVTVITCKSASRVRASAGDILRNLNLSDVKKIEFVSLTTIDDRFSSQNIKDDASISQEGLISEEGPDVASLWNVVQLECNAVSLECYLRQWLRDESTDKEHLRLEIGGLTIKCDMQERLLNPDELPFRASFCTNSDLYMCTVAQGSRGQSKVETLPIIQVKVKQVIPDDVVCESIIFGRPVVLVTSACWQMDWDELEANQGHFLALCKRLSDSSEWLVCENLTRQQGRHRNYSLSNINQPKGQFVIMPSKSSASLLLKYISPRELLLPTRIESIPDELDLPNGAMENIETALGSVGKIFEFNPLEHESGLCESLKSALIPKTSNTSSRPVSKKPRKQSYGGTRFPS